MYGGANILMYGGTNILIYCGSNFLIYGGDNIFIYCGYWVTLKGTLWRSWLIKCTTRRKVAGSISDRVIAIFYRHNPSGRTMALGLTQPLTK
jgi:hypothetical protein